jgi:hypothetical protein
MTAKTSVTAHLCKAPVLLGQLLGCLQALLGLYPLVDLVCELDVRRVYVPTAAHTHSPIHKEARR